MSKEQRDAFVDCYRKLSAVTHGPLGIGIDEAIREAERRYPDAPPPALARAPRDDGGLREAWLYLRATSLRIALQTLYDATPDCEGGDIGKACLMARNTLNAIPQRSLLDKIEERAALATPQTQEKEEHFLKEHKHYRGPFPETAPPETQGEPEERIHEAFSVGPEEMFPIGGLPPEPADDFCPHCGGFHALRDECKHAPAEKRWRCTQCGEVGHLIIDTTEYADGETYHVTSEGEPCGPVVEASEGGK